MDAIAAVEGEFARGTRRTLLVLPTGCGKTVVFAELSRRVLAANGTTLLGAATGKRVLAIAHRDELLTQAQRKFADVGVRAGIEKADRRAGLAPVVVASVQTLKGKRLERFGRDEFALVVVDEGHHAQAASYRAILDYFDGARVLLVTATPDRADGKALGEVCDSVAFTYELRDAIRDGWLAPITARRIVLEGVNLAAVKTRSGDLANDELGAVMLADEAVLGVVVPLLDEAGDRRTIVFAVNVEHAYALATALRDRRPSCARVAHGEMDQRERAEILADFRRGDFQFLVNVALFTEGFDEPTIECVAVARPTKSRALFVQMVGRGTRLSPGKRDCLVLDFTGNAGKHKLVGPLDALAAGENVEPELRAEAERLLEHEQHELGDILDQAAAELARKRAEYNRSAVAVYLTHDVDPFLGEFLGPPIGGELAKRPATPNQLEQLAKIYGEKHKIPPGLTHGDAIRILEANKERRKRGLATVKQAMSIRRWLQQSKLDTRGVEKLTFEQANDRIAIIANYSWRPDPRARSLILQLEAKEMLARDREQRQRGAV